MIEITVALTPTAKGSRSITLQAEDEEMREEILERIGDAMHRGGALVLSIKEPPRTVVVNAAHIVYAQ